MEAGTSDSNHYTDRPEQVKGHIVFTGKLSSMGRKLAPAKAKDAGYTVGTGGVTKSTTILVCGKQREGTEISAKIAAARKMKEEEGHCIKTIDEDEFLALLGEPAVGSLDGGNDESSSPVL